MGLFSRSGDSNRKHTCWPQGRDLVDGLQPESFADHDFRPAPTGHINSLGAAFDWVEVCARCGAEDWPVDRRVKKVERTRRIDEVDAVVIHLPEWDDATSRCPQQTDASGFHEPAYKKLSVTKNLIVQYETRFLTDKSHYKTFVRRSGKVGRRSADGNVNVWRCGHCGTIVRSFTEKSPDVTMAISV